MKNKKEEYTYEFVAFIIASIVLSCLFYGYVGSNEVTYTESLIFGFGVSFVVLIKNSLITWLTND